MIIDKQTFTDEDYEIVDRKVVYEGVFRYVHYNLRHRLFKGGWTPIFKRELLERTSAVGVLPYDPILDKVVLIYQFRPGAIVTEEMKITPHLNSSCPWLIEIVAGVFNANESPEALATREAQEEAGCQILGLYPIGEYFVSPGGSNEYMHVYCGRIHATQTEGTYGLEKENEDIYAFTLDAEEAFELLRQGRIKTSLTIIALQWLQINHHFIRDFWLKNNK